MGIYIYAVIVTVVALKLLHMFTKNTLALYVLAYHMTQHDLDGPTEKEQREALEFITASFKNPDFYRFSLTEMTHNKFFGH